eukprot:15921278-Heterocapsa_arctica.AAC.1
MPPGNSVFCCSLAAAADTLRRPCLPCPAPVQLTSARGAGARMLPQRPCRTSRGSWGAPADPQAGPCGCSWGR